MLDQVGINDLVRRQTAGSRFSHYAGALEDVAALANKYLYAKTTRQGYRPGVTEVDVPPEGFFCGVVQLKEGDRLAGAYEARRPGEEPRKSTAVVGGQKMPAKAVTLILYSYDTLLENKENSTMKPHELISINARPTVEAEPINPGVLMANHFGADGGTATKMTDAEFVAALKVSTEYWKDKAMVAEPVKGSNTVPTKKGWYWSRYTGKLIGKHSWTMIEVIEWEGGLYLATGEEVSAYLPTGEEVKDYEWVGPLEEPFV